MLGTQALISRKNIVVILIVIVVVAAAIGTAAYISSRPKPLEKVSVILDFVPNGQHVPFFVGVDRGFFSKYGLDVTVQSGSGSFVAVRAVASGKADFGDADAGGFVTIMQRENITNVRIVSTYFQHSPLAVLFVKGRGINTPKDLEGKTVNADAGSAIAALFPLFAKKAGIDPSKVTIVTETPATCPVSLLAGKFPASLCLFSRALVDLKPQTAKLGLQMGSFNYSDYGLDTYGLAIITNRQLITSKPQVVSAFLKAFWEAAQFTAKNPEQGVDSFMKFNPHLNRTLILGEWKWALGMMGNQILTATDPTSVGRVDPARMDGTITIIAQGFGITRPNPAQVFTNDYLTRP